MYKLSVKNASILEVGPDILCERGGGCLTLYIIPKWQNWSLLPTHLNHHWITCARERSKVVVRTSIGSPQHAQDEMGWGRIPPTHGREQGLLKALISLWLQISADGRCREWAIQLKESLHRTSAPTHFKYKCDQLCTTLRFFISWSSPKSSFLPQLQRKRCGVGRASYLDRAHIGHICICLLISITCYLCQLQKREYENFLRFLICIKPTFVLILATSFFLTPPPLPPPHSPQSWIKNAA
jgi:hypothetical protein